MLAAKPVILALHDEKRPATQFLAAAQAASVDVKLPCLAEMALYREFNHLAEAQHYEEYFSILSGKAEPDVIKICEIPEDKREGFIIRSTIQVISDLPAGKQDRPDGDLHWDCPEDVQRCGVIAGHRARQGVASRLGGSLARDSAHARRARR